MRTPRLPAPGNTLLPVQPTNPAPGLSRRSPKAKTLKFNSGAAAPAPHGANTGLGGSRGELPSTCPPARQGAPDPAPAYFAAVAHTKEVIPQHLHGAGPGGVDERPSEDVRQGRHPGGTHDSGGAQRGVRGPRRAHRAEARRGLPAAAGSCQAGTSAGLVLPPLPRAIACPLQTAPRGWLPASSMPIGFFSPVSWLQSLLPCFSF